MNQLQVKFLGSGDAFGSGGRLQTCIMVKRAGCQYLLDCGPTVLIAMRKFAVRSNDIDLIIISHLHGDHFAGVPYFILEAQHVSKREKPLLVAGPPGLEARITEAMEALFPGSSQAPRLFQIRFVEMEPGSSEDLCGVRVETFRAEHPSGAPSLILRTTCQGKVVAYSGDTEWTPELLMAARNADIFITECSVYEQKIKYHLNYKTLVEYKEQLQAGMIVLTHMGEELLDLGFRLEFELADDGKEFYL